MHDDFDFDTFLTSGVSKLTGYCAALLGSADAEDAVQEAYVRLWKNLPRIQDERAASAFLYRTAYRVCIDTLRARKRFRPPEKPLETAGGMSERMERALMALKPVDRAVIYSRVVEECAYAEIAARFHQNELWARKRYSLARKRLEQLLGKDELT